MGGGQSKEERRRNAALDAAYLDVRAETSLFAARPVGGGQSKEERRRNAALDVRLALRLMARATWWCPIVATVAFTWFATSTGRPCAPSAATEQGMGSSHVPGA